MKHFKSATLLTLFLVLALSSCKKKTLRQNLHLFYQLLQLLMDGAKRILLISNLFRLREVKSV